MLRMPSSRFSTDFLRDRGLSLSMTSVMIELPDYAGKRLGIGLIISIIIDINN